MTLLDDAVDELYAADLDRFVARRTELVTAAKAAGDREAAAAITALRKPTRSAFTINRLARTDPDAIDALVDVGTELQRAQTAGDGTALRELNTRRRQLLDRLTGHAFEIIGVQSPTAGQREEVTATLTAGLADTGIADQLRQGILVRAAESSGFGFSPPELTLIRSPQRAAPAGDAAPPTDAPVTTKDEPAARSAPPSARTAADPAADRARRRAAEEADRAAAAQQRREREQAAREKAVAAAQAEADAADAAVQESVDRADAAQQLITRLTRELSSARRALAEAQKQTRAAEQKQKSARAALNKVRG